MLNEQTSDSAPSPCRVGMVIPGNKMVITVDASYFPHNPDDLVEQGVPLGVFQGKRVDAPCRARIESISFDADDHALHVVLAATQ